MKGSGRMWAAELLEKGEKECVGGWGGVRGGDTGGSVL